MHKERNSDFQLATDNNTKIYFPLQKQYSDLENLYYLKCNLNFFIIVDIVVENFFTGNKKQNTK